MPSETKKKQAEQSDNDTSLVEKSSEIDKKVPIGIAVACLAICGLYYLQVIINSSEKWFHLLIVAMLAFAGIQVNQYYLNQKEIEAKMQIFL